MIMDCNYDWEHRILQPSGIYESPGYFINSDYTKF